MHDNITILWYFQNPTPSEVTAQNSNIGQEDDYTSLQRTVSSGDPSETYDPILRDNSLYQISSQGVYEEPCEMGNSINLKDVKVENTYENPDDMSVIMRNNSLYHSHSQPPELPVNTSTTVSDFSHMTKCPVD